MTPGVKAAQRHGVAHTLHAYRHDSASTSYGLEAAEQLQLPPERVFKTLVVSLDTSHLAVALVPVCDQLHMKSVARVFGARKAAMADAESAQRATGYVLGGVSPLGQKKRLPMVIDRSALAFDTIFVSAGRRGLEIELSPQDLASVTGAGFEELRR